MKTNKKLKLTLVISLMLLLSVELVYSIDLCDIPAFQNLPFCIGEKESSGKGIQKSFLCRYLGFGCKSDSTPVTTTTISTGECDFKDDTANCYCVNRDTGECCNDGYCDTCNSVCEYRNVNPYRCDVGQMMGCDYTQSHDGIVCMGPEECSYDINEYNRRIASENTLASLTQTAESAPEPDPLCAFGVPDCPTIREAPDHINGYYIFDGENDFIDIHQPFKESAGAWHYPEDYDGSLTFEAWIYPERLETFPRRMAVFRVYGYHQYTHLYYSLPSYGNGKISLNYCGSGDDIRPENWNYVVVTQDEEEGVKFYINGEISMGDCEYNYFGEFRSFQIGYGNMNYERDEYYVDPGPFPDPERFFKGRIDEVRVSDEVRSPKWIAASYYMMNEEDFINYGSEESEQVIDWGPPSWVYRKKLSFNNRYISNIYTRIGDYGSEDLVNFPVMVKLTPSNFDYSHVNEDGSDIRFFASHSSDQLDWHIEEWNHGQTSWLWVEIPRLEIEPVSNDYFWIYYGNPAAGTNQNIEGTYESSFKSVLHLNREGVKAEDSTSWDNDGEIWGATYNHILEDYELYYYGMREYYCDDTTWRDQYVGEEFDCDNPHVCVVCCNSPTTTTTTIPTTTTTIPCGFLKIFKFNDLNGNGIWEVGEPRIGEWEYEYGDGHVSQQMGWKFYITGAYDHYKEVETNEYGVYFSDCLPYGTYIVEDQDRSYNGWKCTTENPQQVIINSPELKELRFGNRKIED